MHIFFLFCFAISGLSDVNGETNVNDETHVMKNDEDTSRMKMTKETNTVLILLASPVSPFLFARTLFHGRNCMNRSQQAARMLLCQTFSLSSLALLLLQQRQSEAWGFDVLLLQRYPLQVQE